MHKKNLQRIRRVFAAIFFLGITLMFLDFTGTLHTFFGWMAKAQFLPAVLVLNFIVIAILLIITLLFGRCYCSVICPMGGIPRRRGTCAQLVQEKPLYLFQST